MAKHQVCRRCQRKNSVDARFCAHCGVTLEKHDGADTTEDSIIGKVIDRRFRIIEQIGKGGMASVYRAQQISVGREVALKILHHRFLTDAMLKRRFLNEAALASRLNHPNTITIHDLGETHDGYMYIAMELIRGVSLKGELKKYKPMSWRRACRIAVQIASSLQNAHENNIIHRDLKPDNVMLTWSGIGRTASQIVKVLDFGIAKIISDDGSEQSRSVTSPNELFGTPEYMSPEQVSGKELDNRTDIYSLGIILYRMITGELPFRARTPLMIMTHHLHEPPCPFRKINANLKSLPRGLERFVMSMLQKKPSRRPQTMNEVASRLGDMLKDRSRGFPGWTPACGIEVGAFAKNLEILREHSQRSIENEVCSEANFNKLDKDVLGPDQAQLTVEEKQFASQLEQALQEVTIDEPNPFAAIRRTIDLD